MVRMASTEIKKDESREDHKVERTLVGLETAK